MYRMRNIPKYLDELETMAEANPEFGAALAGMQAAIYSIQAEFSEIMPLAVMVDGVLCPGLGIVDQDCGKGVRIIGVMPHPGMVIKEMIMSKGESAKFINLEAGQTLNDINISDH